MHVSDCGEDDGDDEDDWDAEDDEDDWDVVSERN